jgi:hypothetical protein
VPFSPFIPIAGAVSCLLLIVSAVKIKTLILFAAWVAVGMTIYFLYGYKKVSNFHEPIPVDETEEIYIDKDEENYNSPK